MAAPGRLRHHDEVFEGSHEPLIDADTWEQAADILAACRKRGRGRRRRAVTGSAAGSCAASAAKR